MKAALMDKFNPSGSNYGEFQNYLACEMFDLSHTTAGEKTSLISTNSTGIFVVRDGVERGISSSNSRKKRAEKFFYAIFNTANAALGTGVLGYPYAYRQSG